VTSAEENWLTRLITESGPELVRFLSRRMSSRAEAEDLAQEVYLRLLRVEEPEAIHDPRSFALRVASNVAYEWRMSARNRFEHTTDLMDPPDERGDPYRKLVHAQQMQRFSRALDTLSPIQRAIVLLHRRDGLTYEEIARIVGLSVQMVNKHLAKSISICKEQLTDTEPKRMGDKPP
jgi:RNA polymerase sigma-19 factor, ECF subfamily